MSFPYKTVLVTGASAGLGLALAEKMIEDGCFVIAVARREDRLKALVEKHGADKVAAEPFDMMDLEAMPEWVDRITKTYPTLSSILLNAGIQRSMPFAKPELISLPSMNEEIVINYTAPLTLTVLFLPHLQSLRPSPASIVLVSSGLALVPLPRCGNYCATKAAIHSLAWSLRYQLSGEDDDEDGKSSSSSSSSRHIKVMEIIPPAVRTELHTSQPDLAALGVGQVGIGIDDFMRDAWAGLVEGKEEIPVSEPIRKRVEGEAEKERKSAMLALNAMLKKMMGI